jgi:hypothetical protein
VQKTIHDLGKLEKQTPTKGNMNNQFDELAKGLAQLGTRRQAFKKFGVGLAGIMLASLGFGNRAAGNQTKPTGTGFCSAINNLRGGYYLDGFCVDPNGCIAVGNLTDCPRGKSVGKGRVGSPCGYLSDISCST